MPIDSSYHARNFITKITKYEYICNMYNSMTVLDEIIPIIIFMIEKFTTGTYNLTNPGYICHNEILDMYSKIIDENFTYKNFSIQDQNKILLSKRSNNILNTNKLSEFCKLHNLTLNNIQLAVENTLKKMKSNHNIYN
jgi:3,5-epimerase/4-reductase